MSSPKELRIIVNADDLGISPEANSETFAFMQQGVVTSATAIANGPWVEAACRDIKNFPQCSFGVHLNLTEFSPLTGPSNLTPLLDQSGTFVEDRIRRVRIDSQLAQGIFEEFCAQIKKLTSLGMTISDIDSHHHVHTLPSVLRILKRVQRKYGIRRVRLSRNIYGPSEPVPIILRCKKAIYNLLLKHYFSTKTTQGFTDFKSFYQIAQTGAQNAGATPRYRSVELMVHPGYLPYAEETDLLRGEWQASFSSPVKLISYNDLV